VTPPAAAPAVRARTLAPPRRLVPAPRPRRVSGPARPARLRQPAAEAARVERGLLRSIASHLPLDRLIRGRAWIAIVVFALLGIVTLQLMLLKLNAGIGHSLERAALLQRENAALSIENSELAAGGRVEAAAERLGMGLVPAGSLKFLTARAHSDLSRAAGVLSAPAASVTAETNSASTTGAASTESSEASKSSEASETPSSSEKEAPTGASTPQAEAGAQSTAPASHESTPAPASSEKEVTSTTAGASEAGPAGGTQAGPTG
jgi:hypothetical protein